MKKVFQIAEDKIVNVVIQPEGFECDNVFWVDFNPDFGIGDSYDYQTGEFTQAPEPEQPPEPIPEVISDRQFFQQLAIVGIITETEAINAVANGTLPKIFNDAVDTLPQDQQFNARILLSGATNFQRNHELTLVFAAFAGIESDQVDQLWIAASKL